MKLSNYVIKVHKKDETILFNTINSCIVAIEKDYINGDDINDNLMQEHIKFLDSNYFFISDKDALDIFYSKKYIDDSFNLIISPTENCNFHCYYCYENNFDSKNKIEYNTINNIYAFMESMISTNNINKLFIDFIGGEPLICKDKIIYIVDLFKNLKIDKYYTIETNGSLLDERILDAFDNEKLVLSIPLTSEYDHNKLRKYMNDKDSYDDIMNNIINNKKYFKNENIKLSIRYNVNNENYLEFKQFYKYLKKLFDFQFSVDLAIINNYPFNNYKNELPINEYYKWKNNIANTYEELKINDINTLNRVTNRGCFAYNGYGIKVYSDGALGLCNAWDFNKRRSNINNIKDGQSFKELFNDIFNKPTERLGKFCENCKYLFLCGGPRFCRGDNQCDFIELDIYDYIMNF